MRALPQSQLLSHYCCFTAALLLLYCLPRRVRGATREVSSLMLFFFLKSVPRRTRQARREASSFSDAHVSSSCQHFFFMFLPRRTRQARREVSSFSDAHVSSSCKHFLYLFIFFIFFMSLPRRTRQARREVSSFSDAHVSSSCQSATACISTQKTWRNAYIAHGKKTNSSKRKTQRSRDGTNLCVYTYIFNPD